MFPQQYYENGYDPKFSLAFIFIFMHHCLCASVFLSVFNYMPVKCKGGKRNFVFATSWDHGARNRSFRPNEHAKLLGLADPLFCIKSSQFIFMRYLPVFKTGNYFTEWSGSQGCEGSCLFLPRCWYSSCLPLPPWHVWPLLRAGAWARRACAWRRGVPGMWGRSWEALLGQFWIWANESSWELGHNLLHSVLL